MGILWRWSLRGGYSERGEVKNVVGGLRAEGVKNLVSVKLACVYYWEGDISTFTMFDGDHHRHSPLERIISDRATPIEIGSVSHFRNRFKLSVYSDPIIQLLSLTDSSYLHSFTYLDLCIILSNDTKVFGKKFDITFNL